MNNLHRHKLHGEKHIRKGVETERIEAHENTQSIRTP